MSELDECFLCRVELEDEDVVLVQARTNLPKWYVKRICRVCAEILARRETMTVECDDEFWTVRERRAVVC